jgi:hypothetical protein
VTSPTAELPPATTAPSGNSVPPTTTVGGLNAARAEVVLAPQVRHDGQQARHGRQQATHGRQQATHDSRQAADNKARVGQ